MNYSVVCLVKATWAFIFQNPKISQIVNDSRWKTENEVTFTLNIGIWSLSARTCLLSYFSLPVLILFVQYNLLIYLVYELHF